MTVIETTLLDSIDRFGEPGTIRRLESGEVRLTGSFKGQEAEIVASLKTGEWE
jgi:hypothetical protein